MELAGGMLIFLSERIMETGVIMRVIRFLANAGGDSAIMSEPAIFPKMYILKMGIFPRIPQPEAESFAAHRHEWQGVHEGVTQFETLRGGKKLGE